MDFVDPKKRSKMMSSVRGRNSRLEVALRHELHKLGFRYRLYRKDLPGKPDLTMARYRSVVLFNGCFWHQHGCTRSTLPASNTAWWRAKLQANIQRDRDNIAALRKLGWKVLVVWECSIRGRGQILHKAIKRVASLTRTFLISGMPYAEICKKDGIALLRTERNKRKP